MGRFQADAFNSSIRPNSIRPNSSTPANPFSASPPARQHPAPAAQGSTSQSRVMSAVLYDRLTGLGDRLLTVLGQFLLQRNEPQVRWWRDAEGYDHYSVYDPISQRTQVFDNSRQVRAWLEQRYYE